MGVVRDRLGAYEDQFMSTVFLGSGLLFMAMTFAAAAVGISTILTSFPAIKWTGAKRSLSFPTYV